MKYCTKCEQHKPLDQFYPHPQTADGYLNHCKDCVKSRIKRRRVEAIEEYRQRDRTRFKTPERKEVVKHARVKMKEEHPEKIKARAAVSNALRDGRLTKEPCHLCGNPDSEAHHEDYNRPLDVHWVCQECHQTAVHRVRVA